MPDGLPVGTSAKIRFYGAEQDPGVPFAPDLTSEVGPFFDITALDGKPFIRFELAFDLGDDPRNAEKPEVLSLRIRYHFE